MLHARLFFDFKGADTLLVWGDAEGIAELRRNLAALSRGDALVTGIDDLQISVSERNRQPSILSRGDTGLLWACRSDFLFDVEELIAVLEEASSGHQFIDTIGLVRQVIISKCEYPETLMAS